jgi:hypothetical protein
MAEASQRLLGPHHLPDDTLRYLGNMWRHSGRRWTCTVHYLPSGPRRFSHTSTHPPAVPAGGALEC